MLLHYGHGMVAHDLMMPKPHGCLQIKVKGVHGLVGTEWKLQSILTGARSNDPYVTVIDSVKLGHKNPADGRWRLQHFNLRVYDDGLLQMFREQQIGMASQEDLMARKLGLSVMDLFGMSSLDFYDKEQEKDFTCPLDTIWEGREDHAELRNAKPPSITLGGWAVFNDLDDLGAIFLDDDEPEPVWPHFVLRVCFGKLEMRHFTMKPTDLFSIHGTVMPGFDSTGSHHEDPKATSGEKWRPRQRLRAAPAERVGTPKTAATAEGDAEVDVCRMTGGRMGRACKVATFDQGFRFLVRDPRNTKIHLTFTTVSDFDKTDTHQLGELTLEVNSLLKEKDLSLDIKNEELMETLQIWTTGKVVIYLRASQDVMAGERRWGAGHDEVPSFAVAEGAGAEGGPRPGASERPMVRVTSARGLRAADFTITRWGTSDPYCSVELAGKAKSGFKTQVQEKTLEPYWDYEGTINNYKSGMALKFNVYDKDFSLKDPGGLLGGMGFDGEISVAKNEFLRIEITEIW
eukprot:s780_g16.t1